VIHSCDENEDKDNNSEEKKDSLQVRKEKAKDITTTR